MKRLNFFLTMGVLLLATPFFTRAQDGAPTIRVAAIRGSVTARIEGGGPKRVAVGTVLSPGASIATAPGAAVDLFLGNEAGTVRLAEKSSLQISQFTVAADRTAELQMHLSAGTLLGMGNQLLKSSRYQIKISNGIVDVQARQFRVGAEGLLVSLDGILLFAYIPPDGTPVLHKVAAPPPSYFWPTSGVQPAPEALAREVTAQANARLD